MKKNLKLMYCVCDKWCVPDWLIESIETQLHLTHKIVNLNSAIDKLTKNIYKCANCGKGINKYFNNTSTSCKYHPVAYTKNDTNVYRCCNKEEPCKVGYHVIDTSDLVLLLKEVVKMINN